MMAHDYSHSTVVLEPSASQIESLLRTEIDFIPSKTFEAQNPQHMICESIAELIETNSETSVGNDLPAHLARLCESELLTAEAERECFREMNRLKFVANVLRGQLNVEEPNGELMADIQTALKGSQDVRDYIVRCNMRLVMSIVKKFVTPQVSFDELLSDGIWSLVQCVEKFDFERGFRFSTYAYRSIARSSYRKSLEPKKDAARNTYTSETGFELEERESASLAYEQAWETQRNLLAGMLHHLDRRERFVVRCRYALGGHRKTKTFQYLADKLGVSKERVRQLEKRAVKKLQKLASLASH